MKHLLLFLILLLSGSFSFVHGQSADRPAPSVLDEPKWVRMMDDPDVNYYEALKVYDDYWKTHPKPMSESEIFGSGAEKGTRDEGRETKDQTETLEQSDDIKKRKELLAAQPIEVNEYLKYQSKRFEGWARDSKPWVQEDGRILTYEQRMEIWKKQQEELRQQENKK